MQTPAKDVVDLERKFWQAIVEQDADTAIDLLCEPALMVSTHGAMKFDHDGYRKMAEQGSLILTSYELSNMQIVFPNENTAVLTYHVWLNLKPRAAGSALTQEMNDTSTWIRTLDGWKCVVHTETPAGNKSMAH